MKSQMFYFNNFVHVNAAFLEVGCCLLGNVIDSFVNSKVGVAMVVAL
jgi:hypothetical protein